MKNTHPNTRGFTLIEIVLALMVASMGILVIMGLFVGGLSAQQTAVDETQGALFAEQVLQSLRALARDKWGNLGSFPLPPVAGDLWKSGQPAPVQCNGGVYTLRYIAKGSEDIEEFAVRYKVDVTSVQGKPNVKRIRLEVWDEVYGDIDVVGSRVYWTEVFNTKLK